MRFMLSEPAASSDRFRLAWFVESGPSGELFRDSLLTSRATFSNRAINSFEPIAGSLTYSSEVENGYLIAAAISISECSFGSSASLVSRAMAMSFSLVARTGSLSHASSSIRMLFFSVETCRSLED